MLTATYTATATARDALTIHSDGGLTANARIFNVVSLADRGPGTLREAIDYGGPRIILFSVAGYIDLKDDISIDSGRITIAGQTAPGAGVILRGGTLRIRASDVVLEHFSVLPGSTKDPVVAEKRDGISVYGSPKRGVTLERIVLHNMSVGWAVDENIGIQGLVDGMKIERSLVYEGLTNGGHPKGNHSMNIAVGATVRRMIIADNVLANSNWRSPRLSSGNQAAIVNNVVYGFGDRATHIDASREFPAPVIADVVGNTYIRAGDRKCRRPVIDIGQDIYENPASRLFLKDNIQINEKGRCPEHPDSVTRYFKEAPSFDIAPVRTMPAAESYQDIIRQAGARPAHRHPIDSRVVQSIARNLDVQVSDEMANGGWPVIEASAQSIMPPVTGNNLKPEQVGAMKNWLCERSVKVGDASCRAAAR